MQEIRAVDIKHKHRNLLVALIIIPFVSILLFMFIDSLFNIIELFPERRLTMRTRTGGGIAIVSVPLLILFYKFFVDIKMKVTEKSIMFKTVIINTELSKSDITNISLLSKDKGGYNLSEIEIATNDKNYKYRFEGKKELLESELKKLGYTLN